MGVTKLHNLLILSLNFAAGVTCVQRQIRIHRCVKVDIHLAMYVASWSSNSYPFNSGLLMYSSTVIYLISVVVYNYLI